MTRVYNFSAGPAALPLEVLQQAQAEMLDWRGTGCSVMEVSHRGKEFEACNAEAEQDLRDLLNIPPHYKVLFLQGGASMQWSQILFNLCRDNAHGDFILTGEWTQRAVAEAKRLLPLWGGSVNIVASSEDKNFSYIPPESGWKRREDAAFMHICTNETIQGLEYGFVPHALGIVPLVADMSSHILSRQRPDCPRMFDYQLMADNHSLLNTPPTFGIYLAGLVFQWLKRQGGLAVMEQRNIEKARLLYDYLDQSSFYYSPVNPADRSRMNVPFRIHDESLNEAFLKQSAAAGLVALKGHKAVGGMRASIYNAMPLAGVQALIAFMKDFEQSHG